MRLLSIWFACAIAVASCGGDQPPASGPDAGTPDLAFKSNCGHPGDVGNSIGVGKFCQHQSDCPTKTLCTQLGDPDNFFCTKVCSNSDGGTGECGENAHCACDSTGRGCGCFPDACN